MDLSSVELPDNLSRDHQREKRESTSVESPSKLTRKASETRLTKGLSLRKIDLVFPGNGAKMLSLSLLDRLK